MMSHLLCHFLLMVFLISRAVVMVKASNNTISCGDDNCCQAMEKLMNAVNEINNRLDEQNEKQAQDLQELKVNLNRSLASTDTISTQLEKHSADLLSHDERLKANVQALEDTEIILQSIYGAELGPRDCTDIRAMGNSNSGIYRVYPGSDNRRIETDVYCDFSTSTESWLVFQRRLDGAQNFDRTWMEYESGFGVLDGEFWLGNEKLSLLTMNRNYKLRMELEDFEAGKRWAEYATYSVRPSTDKYRQTVGAYSGDAGDSFTYHDNMTFSTKDADNDLHNTVHCAQEWPGGWWFKGCMYSNLNGLYLGGSHTQEEEGIYWKAWRGANYSLKATEMKITAVY